MNKTIFDAEKKVFIISCTGTIIFSTIGIFVFIVSNSQAVLLDGLFSLITALITLISIWVVSIASKKANDDFHYGLIQARPMLKLFKGIIIFGFIISAVLNSIDSIFSGGSVIPGEIIIIYALLSVIISIVIVFWIWLIGKKNKSSLIKLEIIQWFQDTAISFSVGFVFALPLIIKHPIISYISPYLDSGLVILIALIFSPSIIKIIATSGKELLLGSPSYEVRKIIREKINSICSLHDVQIKNIYMISTAGLFYIDVEYFVSDEFLIWEKSKSIRNSTISIIKSSYPDSEVFVSFFQAENEFSRNDRID